MRNFSIAALALVLLSALACASASSTPGTKDDVVDQKGTVRKVVDTFVIELASDPSTRYQPDNLPAPFRLEGLPVIFSGRTSEVPPNVRMVGNPIHITSIRRVD